MLAFDPSSLHTSQLLAAIAVVVTVTGVTDGVTGRSDDIGIGGT